MLKKAMLAAAMLALTSSPAWATPGKGASKSEGHGSVHQTHKSEAGEKGNGQGKGQSNNGKSHRCKPHRVAYVASGTLVSDALIAGEHNTYSGELTVEVLHTNHHAREAKGKTEIYVVENVDVNGPLSVEALKAGDRVRLIGGVTILPKKCEAGEFTPTRTIRRLVFHAPKATS